MSILAEIEDNLVASKGFAWMYSYFYETSLPLPDNYTMVEKGNTQASDMIMVLLDPIPKKQTKRTKLGPHGDVLLKSRWEILEKRFIGEPVEKFRAIIRKRGESSESMPN